MEIVKGFVLVQSVQAVILKNTMEQVAFKQQKSTPHSSVGWECEIRGPAWLCEGFPPTLQPSPSILMWQKG